MDEIVARGEAVVARSAKEIARLLNTAPLCQDPEKYYSRPTASVSRLLRESVAGQVRPEV